MHIKLIVNHFQTPFGCLEILHDEHLIYQSRFINIASSSLTQNSLACANPNTISQIKGDESQFSQQVVCELQDYFSNPHHRFQLKLSPIGTPYQKQVWHSLLVIPAGRTLTYGDIATRLNTSPRAIGQACKKNPITLFIPCHRVIAKHDLGGYMGQPEAMKYKEMLLQHEGFMLPITA